MSEQKSKSVVIIGSGNDFWIISKVLDVLNWKNNGRFFYWKGIIGLTSAYELSKTYKKVYVVEQEGDVCMGASFQVRNLRYGMYYLEQ